MKRMALFISVGLLAFGGYLALGTSIAQAESSQSTVHLITNLNDVKNGTRMILVPQQSGNEYCGNDSNNLQYCLNAYGGGPFVKFYDGGPNTVNNDFFLYKYNNQYEMEDTDGGAWNGYCIGDAYNNQYRADSSLDNCPSSGNAGWGTIISQWDYCSPTQAVAFKDQHWNGWIGNGSAPANASPVYLNNAFNTYTCFFIYAVN